MKAHNWFAILAVLGVSMDFLDEITGTQTSPGVLYGPTGFLAGLNNQLPAGVCIGTLLAVVGVGGMVYNHTLKM